MKNMIDFFKIKDGELGAFNFNNMIPVTDKNYTLVDLNKETLTIAELKYQKLLKEQLNWLNAHYRQVKNKSLKSSLFWRKYYPDIVIGKSHIQKRALLKDLNLKIIFYKLVGNGGIGFIFLIKFKN